jgi:hypothetical protein
MVRDPRKFLVSLIITILILAGIAVPAILINNIHDFIQLLLIGLFAGFASVYIALLVTGGN